MLTFEKGRIDASGEVGLAEDGFTRNQFLQAMAMMDGEDFELLLMSEGGNVFEGQSIYNHMSAYQGKITAVLDSMVASIATVIMCAADDVLAYRQAKVMIHNPYTLMIGDAAEFRHTAEVLDKLALDAAEIYAEKAGKDTDYWLEVMAAETYFTAQEAFEVGLVDGIIQKGGRKPDPDMKAKAGAASVIATPRLNVVEVEQKVRRQRQATAVYRPR